MLKNIRITPPSFSYDTLYIYIYLNIVKYDARAIMHFIMNFISTH